MATGYSKWPTALSVIQDACGQLSLPVPVAAVAAPDDVTAQQMVSLLSWCGRRLVKPTATMRWTALKRTWNLTTAPPTTLYDLPDDWDSFIPMTGWNTSLRNPLSGPASDPQWSSLVARSLGTATVNIVYRVRNRQFELLDAGSTPQDLFIDYSSRGWVKHLVNTPATYGDKITDDSDELLYDNELITAKLKLAFLQSKGFDTTAAQSEYNEIEEQAMNADTEGAAALVFSSSASVALISTANLPSTGYGS